MNSSDSFLPFARQLIFTEDAQEVEKILLKDLITRGPKVQEFEEKVAALCGAKYAVSFNSGTSALFAASLAADITPHDRVITTPNTFIATSIGAFYAKACPVFLDIDELSGNFDLNQLEETINQPSTRGKEIIIPVHFAGNPVDMERIGGMVRNPKTIIIEDASLALGSFYPNGEKVGSSLYSDMTVLSFHPNKCITTGEGGMVLTNSHDFCRRLRRIRNNGLERDEEFLSEELTPWYYEIQEISGNFNFTEFQAALGISQLKHLDQFKKKREQLVSHYHQRLKSFDHLKILNPVNPHVFHQIFAALFDFQALKKSRARVMEFLKEKGIGSQVFYIPLYRHPIFKKNYQSVEKYFPKMEKFYQQMLALPLHCKMEEEDVERVVKTLRAALFS